MILDRIINFFTKEVDNNIQEEKSADGKVFKIKGMHCNSCAQLIEKELKDKVNSVSASYAKGQAVIDFNENKISEKQIVDAIQKLGYEVHAYNYDKKDGKENTNAGSKLVFGIASAILIFFVLYYIFGFNLGLPEIKFPSIGEKSSLALLFIAGLLTGFHCISMCGGFVVSYTAKNALNGHKGFKQHLVYGGSKVASYAIMGGIFGLIGGIFAFSTGLRGWIAIIAGIFMVFYALSMFGFSFFRKFQFNMNLAKIASQTPQGHYKGPFFTGLLNGLFLACGPLQAMYLYAAGTGNALTGAVSLAVFGIGTLPVMLLFGSMTTVISHKTTAKILKVSAVIVLILGLIMLNRGLSLTGSSLSFDAVKASISNAVIPAAASVGSSAGNVILNNGIQEVNMDVTSSGYSPNSFVLKKGVPVKWNVNVAKLFSCTNELVTPAYGIDVHLKQGLNVIEFTPDKTGTITFTCGMGMLRGSFIVTDTGTANQEQVKAATPSGGSTCSMGSGGGGCGCGG